MPPPAHRPSTVTRTPHGLVFLPTDLRRAHLDELAARVAADLDRGAIETAWARTQALERELDPAADRREPVPPLPVVGRRFAAAHRRLLAGGDGASDAMVRASRDEQAV